jgi:UDP-glucose 4-epimerase
MSRVLVTGGAGFIGHHLVHALVRRDVAVTVLDNLVVGRRENVPARARFVEGDVCDPAAVRDALDGADTVLHLAAMVSIRASVEHFVRDAQVNIMGTLNLLQQMAGRPIRRAILASSMAVYADSDQAEPLSERSRTEPIAPYGAAKLAAEHYWRMMGADAGITATALRYFNTYGPNQTYTPYVGVITIFVRKLLAGEPPVIFGDGEQRRDFVHIDDVVGATLAVLDAPEKAVAGQVFNVGTGHATSVNEVASGLIAMLAPGIRPEYAPHQPAELRNAVADATSIRRTLGWVPQRAKVDFTDVVEFWRPRARFG